MEIHDRGTVKPATEAERTAIAHLRQWCHNSLACPICIESTRAFKAERALNQIIGG